ncbi:hypothetical protein QWZ10_24335 [Paracoccus cavernae]|uniref:GAF domain-containing protein n=1 Tax=Paracoccus cavernae TaxID=1571207 RepID=A0ABT8DCU8_9RHOB|nr:hypothetical protein [Paracoccus cavernae]
MILAADQPDFDRQLTAILQELISFDLAMISLYHDNALIEVASTSQPEQLASEVLASYAKHTYRHSPFFQMHRHKIQSGFYLMENMARHPALARPSGGAEMLELDQGEEVGYVTAGWPKRLKELDIALRVSDRDTVQVALYRTGNRGFSAADLAAVAPIQSSLFAICGRYWQNAPARSRRRKPRCNAPSAGSAARICRRAKAMSSCSSLRARAKRISPRASISGSRPSRPTANAPITNWA